MSAQEIFLDIAFETNSLISEGAKNAIKVAVESKMLSDALALKIPGIKLGLVGNVDKGVKVLIAWDSGYGTPDAVGKAVVRRHMGCTGWHWWWHYR